jgi:zinc protease
MVRRELARNGATISAGASPDFSVAAFASTRPAFDRVWEIFSDVMLEPAFTPEDVAREKELMLVGLRETETSPEGAIDALQNRVLYAGHPYANDPEGTPATIGALTADDLRAYHKKVMQTSQLLLVFVGDLDANELKTKIASTFGKLPRGDYKDTPPAALSFATGSLDVTPRNIPTTYVQGSFAAPSLADPDYPAMRVAITILYNLVYQEVRVRRQLSYAPGAELNTYAANTGNISVSSTDPNQAVSVMLDQVNFMRQRLLPEGPVDEVAASFLTSYYINQQTSAAQAADLAKYELIGGGWRNSFEFLNRVRQVSSADVQRVSEKYMKNIRFAVVGNQLAIRKSVFVPGS